MTVRALLFCVLFVGCPKPGPGPVPPPPPPVLDGPATCADVCRRAIELGCAGSTPTPEGASCLEVCLNLQESGVASWNLMCRARAATCSEAEACEVGK